LAKKALSKADIEKYLMTYLKNNLLSKDNNLSA
jgi:hypothetical protein